MKRNSLLTITLCLFLTVVFYSCKKDNSYYLDKVSCTEADDSLNTYGRKIATLINQNCATSGCHNASAAKKGIDMSTYAGSKSAFASSSGVCAINYGSGCEHMPQGNKLSDADLHDMNCWVKNNYPQ